MADPDLIKTPPLQQNDPFEGSDDDSWGDADDWGVEETLMSKQTTGDSWSDMDVHEQKDDGVMNIDQENHRVDSERASIVNREIEAVNLLAMMQAHAVVDPGSVMINIALGIWVSFLNLTPLQREIHGLDINDRIVIKISFGVHYLGGKRPSITDVGKISQGDPLRFDTVLQDFLYKWPLKDRLQNTFINNMEWPVTLEEFPEHLFTIQEQTGKSIGHCFETLKYCNGRLHQTMEHMLTVDDDDSSKRQKRFHVASLKEASQGLCSFLEGMENQKRELADMSQQYGVAYHILKQAWDVCLRSTDRLREILEITPEQIVDLAESSSPIPYNSHTPEGHIHDLFYIMKFSFLARMGLYASHVMFQSGKTCMICEGELEYKALKPSVCNNEQCQFQFNDMGLGFSLAHEIQCQPHILDMYITMFVAAHKSQKLKLCWPTGVRSTCGNITFSNPERQCPELAALIGMIPAVNELKDILRDAHNQEINERMVPEDVYLKRALTLQNPLLYPTLKWLFTSNRAYIRQLADDEMFTEIPTKYQFIFANASPEKEAQFQRLKREAEQHRGEGNGVIKAWHGSPFGNWHSIMRNGLKNYSGTKNQMHGAAYGRGIYFALNSSTSMSYSNRGGNQAWNRTGFSGGSLKALALCEIVNHADIPKANPYLVIPNDDWVMTRFLFLFDNTNTFNIAAKNVSVSEKLLSTFDSIS